MNTKFTRSERGQRIDQPDFDRVWRGLVEHDANFVSKFVVGDDAIATSWIVSGFGAVESGGNLVVTRGVGLLGWRDELGSVRYGLVAADGEATRSIPVGSFGLAVYGIYVRFDLTDSEWKTRAKWDALNTTEYVENIATRLQANWSLTASLVEPGPEWLKIGEYDNTGAGVYTDMRDLFFEGRSADSYLVSNADWGGGNDRHSNRGLYGVLGLKRFFDALRRQIRDITGGAGWWSAPTLALNSALNLLGRGATQGAMQGHLDPVADDIYELGDDSTPKRWASAAINQIIAGGSLLGSAANAILPRFSAKMATGQTRTLIFESARDDATVRTVRIYRTTSSAVGGGVEGLEVVYGASWNNTGAEWTIDTDVTTASIEAFTTQLSIATHAVGAGATWADTVSASTWTKAIRINSTQTTAPNFDADGGASAGEYRYTPAAAFTKAIHGTSGTSSFDGTDWYSAINTTATGSSFMVKTAVADRACLWPFELPDDATITECRIYGTFNANGETIEANLIRTAATGLADVLQAANEDLDGVTAPVPAVLTPDVPTVNVVHTDQYSYGVWIRGTAAADAEVYRIEIDYTVDKVTLP